LTDEQLSDEELAAVWAVPTVHDTMGDRVLLISYFNHLDVHEQLGMHRYTLKAWRHGQEVFRWMVAEKSRSKGRITWPT
jgi:hypothetical protein